MDEPEARSMHVSPSALESVSGMGTLDEIDQLSFVGPSSLSSDENPIIMGEWCATLSDTREASGHTNSESDLSHSVITPLACFRAVFPLSFLEQEVISWSNSQHPGLELEQKELLRYLGLWLLIGSYPGHRLHDFWSSQEDGLLFVLPDLTPVMTESRFLQITKNLVFTMKQPGQPLNRRETIQPMVDAWHSVMERNFQPSHIVAAHVPSESFSLDSAPLETSNWYTMFDVQTGILFRVDLAGDMEAPCQAREFTNRPELFGALLRLTKKLQASGRICVMVDDHVSVQCLIELFKVGLYACAPVTKHWPHLAGGEGGTSHMRSEAVGTIQACPGLYDGLTFQLVAVRDTASIPTVMCTYGSTDEAGKRQRRKVGSKSVDVTFPQVHHDLLRGQQAVVEHGELCIKFNFEEHIAWHSRQFLELLAKSEANAFLAYRSFHSEPNTYSRIAFRRKLVDQLVLNGAPTDDSQVIGPELQRSRKRARISAHFGHSLLTAPPFTGAFRDGQWSQVRSKYLQRNCSSVNCARQIRTYCECDPTRFWCQNCHLTHVLAMSMSHEVKRPSFDKN